jgi:hypothetical protein
LMSRSWRASLAVSSKVTRGELLSTGGSHAS